MPNIVDLYGNPIVSEPKELQTEDSKLAHLQRHFAEHPSSGLTPVKLASIMRDAEQGGLQLQCELAEDMEEKDAHIFSELQKRRRAVLNLEWSIVPPRNPSEAEKKDAAMLQELMEDMTELDDLILDMGDAILKGYSNHELEWYQVEGFHLARVHHRDPSWFKSHPERRNEIRLNDNSYEGAALQPFGWISHRHQAKSGYLGRSALARILAWPFLFKNYSIRDLAEFLEIYGLPLRLGKYPSGASDREKSTLLNAVMSIGHNAGGIIPKGMEIDFQEAAKGAADPFEAMISWCERSQSKAILGGTLTSQADGKTSTNALGNVHNEVRQELRDSDAKQIAATLTRDLVYPQYVLNGKSFQSQRRIPRFEFNLTEPEDLAMFAENLPPLIDRGLRIPQAWVHDQLQIPEAQGDEPVLGIAAQQPTALAALSAQAEAPDQLDNLVDNLGNQADQATDDLLAQLRQLVDSAESLEQLQSELMKLKLDNSAMETAMTQALTVAALAGRYELLQDAQ